MVAWMHDNSPARRHFRCAKNTCCAWTDGKTTEKSFNSNWLVGKNIRQSHVGEVSGHVFQPGDE